MRNCLLRPSFQIIPKLHSHTFFSSFCEDKNQNFCFSRPPHLLPKAKKVPYESTDHGVTRKDEFHWMSNTKDPDFISYISQENSYAEAFMRNTEKFQRTLYTEMVSRISTTVTTPLERWGPWFYYQCVPEGREYPVLCRKLAVEHGWENTITSCFKGGFDKEQILLDWNEIAQKHGYVHVGTCRVSPDHNFLAYTLDTTGGEQFHLQVKDLQNNCLLPQFRVNGVVSLAWAMDSSTLFYTLCDQNQRPHRLLCTKLGSASVDDIQIYSENDSRYCIDITSTKDGKFVTVNSNSRTSSEVYVINAMNPLAGLQRFCKRVSGVQYFLEHHDRFFYVLTNAPTNEGDIFSGNGYYLARCRDDDVQSAHLQDIILPDEGDYLEDMDMFNGNLVLFLNKNSSPSICSIDMPIYINYKKKMKIGNLNPWFFPLPTNVTTMTPGSNHDFTSVVYRVVLSSPVMPDIFVDYDMTSKTFSIIQQEEATNMSDHDVKYNLLSCDSNALEPLEIIHEKEKCVMSYGFHKRNDLFGKYTCDNKEVISHDGVKIPLTILFSSTEFEKGKCPGLLHGYGAYGETLDKSWCSDRLSLLDRGWMLAFADVRGGAGADPSWHRSGSLLSKMNSVYDFVSCAEYLINEGFVNKSKLGAVGISAGSLLVGAVINMHPELFCAAILKVPFLDVLNTLLDPSLPLTTLDYEEFGDPQRKSSFDYIMNYSPYDNIPPGICCPPMLVSSSFNDARVGVWEAAKWVAKIRDTACPGCASSVILKTDMNSGHFCEGGRLSHCKKTAYDYAFLMKVMGTL